MSIIISRLDKTNFTIKDVHRLVDEAWQRWFEAGLDSILFHLTDEQFAHTMNRRVVFVALDGLTGELLGCHMLKLDRNCVSGSSLAVAPRAQGRGVATRLLEAEAEIAIRAGYTHMIGATATTATWSVRWHLKNGYRIIGFNRQPQDNHPLYVFRKQLVPSSIHRIRYSLYSSGLFCSLCYMISYTITFVMKDSDGNLNLCGRIGKIIFSQIHRVCTPVRKIIRQKLDSK